jgi:hypothetical protein
MGFSCQKNLRKTLLFLKKKKQKDYYQLARAQRGGRLPRV